MVVSGVPLCHDHAEVEEGKMVSFIGVGDANTVYLQLRLYS